MCDKVLGRIVYCVVVVVKKLDFGWGRMWECLMEWGCGGKEMTLFGFELFLVFGFGNYGIFWSYGLVLLCGNVISDNDYFNM